MSLTKKDLEQLASGKIELLNKFFSAEPPKDQGEDLIRLWEDIYDDALKSTVIETVSGPSDDVSNPVFPYEKLHAIVEDGGNWKWPRIWRRLDELQRRGPAYRDGDPLNFGVPNPNQHIVRQNVLVVGGGPVGLRLAIELRLGGHQVTVFEKRREVRDEGGQLEVLGFTNRINRPHVSYFLRNDLDRLNGRDFMSSKMCYPIFTQGDTASIGIDELQVLLIKSALLLGVDLRLGVTFRDAETAIDPKTQKPKWQVKCAYDVPAAALYRVEPGSHTETFDVLMGCDGARSRVRESQPGIFGEVDKRNFKKMIGVVANVQKVSRTRLREMGFGGQEPTDMKRAHVSGGGTCGLNYYKASYHNYVIFTPTKDDLERSGVRGKGIFSFLQGRDKVTQAQTEEKARLRMWVQDRCVEAGIPVDLTLSNDGFVEAPNDVMAFDFSEIWKCKKNFAFNCPPLDYDVEKQGLWMGHPLIAPIGLVGDSVTEPFWIAGVGLQRGWNGIMDASYMIDNLYNLTFSGEPEPIAPTTWEDHMERLQKILPTLYECSQGGIMTQEGLHGEYSDQGTVMTQLNKRFHDAEKPQWQLDVDPFTRYEPLVKLARYKYIGAKSLENEHPVVRRTVGIMGISNGHAALRAKKLISVSGKVAPADHVSRTNSAVPDTAATAVPPPPPSPIPQLEVEKAASSKAESRHSMLAEQIDRHVRQTCAAPIAVKTPFNDELWKELPVREEMDSGFAKMAETEWDHMTEKHLSPAQRAELLHIRNMKASLKQQITTLSSSFDAFARAERELLLAGGR